MPDEGGSRQVSIRGEHPREGTRPAKPKPEVCLECSGNIRKPRMEQREQGYKRRGMAR